MNFEKYSLKKEKKSFFEDFISIDTNNRADSFIGK